MMSEQGVGFSLKPLPRWIDGAVGIAEALGLHNDRLQPEPLMHQAAKVAGLPPDFPSHVREALQVLCQSLKTEVHLNWLGVANNYNLLVGGLATLLRVEKMFQDDPSLANEPLLNPMVVIGLPRSGTTFLHRLLSASPDAVGVPLWRHLFPVVLRRFDFRQLEAKALLFPWLAASKSYDIDKMHFVRTDLPDECNFGMRLAGRSMIYWGTNPVHTYLRWLMSQDLHENYQMYRKVLILHQRANPGRRLTLKCPHHIAWLPALAKALPEATIVQTHRDPVECVPSECKLILSVHGISVKELDWRRTVESNHFKVHAYTERSVAFADTPAGARVHHIDYRQLVRDPVGVARAVHDRAGIPFTPSHQATLADFAAENRQHKHGKNQYSAADFGLDPAWLAKEFADYRERFLPNKND